MIQLPDDVINIGYKRISEFKYEQVFHSKKLNFTGTEKEFLSNGFAYTYSYDADFKRYAE